MLSEIVAAIAVVYLTYYLVRLEKEEEEGY